MFGWDDDDFEELAAIRAEEEGWSNPFAAGVPLVCRCHCVEEGEIEALAAAGCGLEEIARRTGATTGCGACRRSVEAILAERRKAG